MSECPACGCDSYVPGLQFFVDPFASSGGLDDHCPVCRAPPELQQHGVAKVAGPPLVAGRGGARRSNGPRRRPSSSTSHRSGTARPRSTRPRETAQCRYWASGCCREGNRCRYAHSHAGVVPWNWSSDRPLLNTHPRVIALRDSAFLGRLQELLTSCCEPSTLGTGRDQLVKMTYSKLQIHRAYRIENDAVWATYNAFRVHCQGTAGPNGSLPTPRTCERNPWLWSSGMCRAANEVYLWHGTDKKTSEAVVQGGFDPRFARMGLFGCGSYFAECSSKSDQYCTPEPISDPADGSYFIFLARVVMGKFTMIRDRDPPGNFMAPDKKVPPLIPGGTGPFDSVYADYDPHKYREHIVYKGCQAYPEYLIEYKRRP